MDEWTPSLTSALENLLERGRELEEKTRAVAHSATPGYWIQRESDAYDKAKEAFMNALDKHIDKHIDARIGEAFKEVTKVIEEEK